MLDTPESNGGRAEPWLDNGRLRVTFQSLPSDEIRIRSTGLMNRPVCWNSRAGSELSRCQEALMHTEINIFDKPIERIRTTCQLMGLGADFDRKLPDLETHLEGLVAEGETSEERLTVSGLSFVKQAS
jgi:hypothetical protein